MNLRALIAINAIGVGVIVLSLVLLRRKRLHVGFAVLWSGAALLGMLFASFRFALEVVTFFIPTSVPFSAIVVAALTFVFAVLIYFSVKLSDVVRQVTEIAQHIGLHELETRGGPRREER